MASITLEPDRQPEAGPELARVQHVQALMAGANAARQEFLEAGQALARLSQQEAELLTQLMDTALRMHAAKIRVDAALAEIKAAAGLL